MMLIVEYLTAIPGALLGGFSRVLNNIMGGPIEQNFSARCFQEEVRTGLWRWVAARRVIDVLFFWDRSHCAEEFDQYVRWAFTVAAENEQVGGR